MNHSGVLDRETEVRLKDEEGRTDRCMCRVCTVHPDSKEEGSWMRHKKVESWKRVLHEVSTS